MNPVTKASVCTLFEKDFDVGVGVLVNSLAKAGFKGTIWAGYKGSLAPTIFAQSTVPGPAANYRRITVTPEVELRLVDLNFIEHHFAHFKPDWMQLLFSRFDSDCNALFYFDPDIVVRARWEFFTDWVAHGIALAGDVNHFMPATHPFRLQWMDFARRHGMQQHRGLETYINSGFIGTRREWRGALDTWSKLTELVEPEAGDLTRWRQLDRSHRFFSANQDTLNVMAMVTEHPVSVVGPDGMDFVPGGFIMAHAIGGEKPWRKHHIRSALAGFPPSKADLHFWRRVDRPLKIYPAAYARYRRLLLSLASFIGRIIRR